MGLQATAKGLTAETEFDCGYLTFFKFRVNLAKTYNSELGLLYEKWCNGSATKEELKKLSNFPDGLLMFLTHSDCDGKFTPKECRKIYKDLEPLKMEMQGHNYGVMKPYNMLEHWKNIFKHCYKRRVNLYFY